jgi:hypothetical protein
LPRGEASDQGARSAGPRGQPLATATRTTFGGGRGNPKARRSPLRSGGRASHRDPGSFILDNGQIVVSGPVIERGRKDRTDTLAVVGGSGAYTAARGTVVVTERRRSTRVEFTFAG